MTRKLHLSSACHETRPTSAPASPSCASVSKLLVSDHFPASCLGLPLAVTFQVKVSSSPMRRSIVVSPAGWAVQFPARLLCLAGVVAGGGAVAAAGVSGAVAGGGNCLTSWGGGVSWGARATTSLSRLTAASVCP